MQCHLITAALHFPCCIQGREGEKKKGRLHPHSTVSSKHLSFQFPNSIITIIPTVVNFSHAFILGDSFLSLKFKKKN